MGLRNSPASNPAADVKSRSALAGPSDGTLAANPFLEFLECIRAQIDERLHALLTAEIADAERYGADVKAMLGAGKDLALRGGKRFRAALCAVAYQGVSPEADMEPALDAGLALELLQAYLLIQDDWMDGDLERRGGPSAHAALIQLFGNEHLGASSAILAGDYLWGLAVHTLASAKVAADRAVKAIQLFSKVHNDVVIGQQLDMLGRASDVEMMHTLKTGSYTVRGPLLLGATLAGADASVLHALEAYARPMGVAFQLRDDLLGMYGTTKQTGKPEGSDLRAGKKTALIAEAESRLDAQGKELLARVFGAADASLQNLKETAAAIEACGARNAVETRLKLLCSEAESLALALPLDTQAREILAGAAAALRMDRDRHQDQSRLALASGGSEQIASALPQTPSNQGSGPQNERALFEGRAFGKVILLGEHAVVYGAPALAAGLSIGAHAVAQHGRGPMVSELQLDPSIRRDGQSEDAVTQSFKALIGELPLASPVLVQATTQLPIGGGLGSSAALGVAIARAVEALNRDAQTPENEAQVLARATAWERVFHGNPSGVDTAAAMRGGFLRFSKNEGIRVIRPHAPIHLCIGWSGESASTKAMVDGVARLKSRNPALVDRNVAAISALVENAARALSDWDLQAFGKLMDLNQMLLAGLMVSTEAIERMCALAREAGALGAKLTGSGGGGSVIALLPSGETGAGQPGDVAATILAAWKAEGFTGFIAQAGVDRHSAGASCPSS